MRQMQENAVSPVVGVMLMLVVTIIIAALVSAFAGGMAKTSDKTPQATIQGTAYVSSKIVVLTHAGGDELVPSKLQILIKKGDDYGPYSGVLLSTGSPLIDNSKVYDSSGNYWINSTTGAVNVKVWLPGQTMYLAYTGLTSDDVGKSLDLEVSTIDGKSISKSKMKVVA